jgi:hypothetical protein
MGLDRASAAEPVGQISTEARMTRGCARRLRFIFNKVAAPLRGNRRRGEPRISDARDGPPTVAGLPAARSADAARSTPLQFTLSRASTSLQRLSTKDHERHRWPGRSPAMTETEWRPQPGGSKVIQAAKDFLRASNIAAGRNVIGGRAAPPASQSTCVSTDG